MLHGFNMANHKAGIQGGRKKVQVWYLLLVIMNLLVMNNF